MTTNFCEKDGSSRPGASDFSVKAGDHLTFGRYPQTEEGNDNTPVEWRVLDVQDGKALIISECGLDVQEYNSEMTEITWETSSLRYWLNTEFLNTAFSSEEQAAILVTMVDNSRKQHYDWTKLDWAKDSTTYQDYADTRDKVFLLSYAESEKYFGTDSAKACMTTDFSANRGFLAGGAASWWLRSPGVYASMTAGVGFDGSLNSFVLNLAVCAVRPALWLDLSKAGGLAAVLPDAAPASDSAADELTFKAGFYSIDSIGLIAEYGSSADLKDLKEGQYYSPALTVDNDSGHTVTVQIDFELDGEEYGWNPIDMEDGDHNVLVLLQDELQAANTVGGHTMVYYADGKEIFSLSWTITDSRKKETADVKAGDVITFGHYPQTASGTDNTPIEWRVLDVQGDKALIISEYGLDGKRYTDNEDGSTWEDSSLRKWLNRDFIGMAFTDDEQDSILITRVDNGKTQHCKEQTESYKDYPDTEDRLFLLSYSEANKYFGAEYYESPAAEYNMNSRVAPTEYAKAHGVEINYQSLTSHGKPAANWYLRSPGFYGKYASSICEDGSFASQGYGYSIFAVRPALWLNLSAHDKQSGSDSASEPDSAAGADKFTVSASLCTADSERIIAEHNSPADLADLEAGQYYSPVARVLNDNGYPMTCQLKVIIDGTVVVNWGNVDYSSYSYMDLYVDNRSFDWDTVGNHDAVYFIGGQEVCRFKWTITDSRNKDTPKSTPTPTPKPTATPRRTPTPTPKPTTTPKPVKTGDILTFGHYQQTKYGDDSTPIEWRVLDVQGDKALVISEYGLDAKPYNTKEAETTWEKCSLRAWLNGEFLDKAFNSAEQKGILTAKVDNSRKQHCNWAAMDSTCKDCSTYQNYPDTEDKIFLLSYAEVGKYFGVTAGQNEVIKAVVAPTDYALSQGSWAVSEHRTSSGKEAGSWFLRSPGSYDGTSASLVSFFGFVSSTGVEETGNTVRPAFWLDITSEVYANEAAPTINTTPQPSSDKTGTRIFMGHYPQTASGTNSTPIEWQVLEVRGDKALIISEHELDAQPFHTEYTAVSWETCSLRKWLNDEFLNSAFSSEERTRIQTTNVDNTRSQYFNWAEEGLGEPENYRDYPSTQDRIFLLSYSEAKKYFTTDEKRICTPTDYAIKQAAEKNTDKEYGYETDGREEAGIWLLRSPGWESNCCSYVFTEGYIWCNTVIGAFGVRPAMWVSLSAAGGMDIKTVEATPAPKPTSTPSPRRTPKMTPRPTATPKPVKTGDILTFGHYPQTKYGDDSTPIEWRVLEVQWDKALVISEYGLDAKLYNAEYFNITWERCSLRMWLNGEFLNKAFSEMEQGAILTTTVDNSKSQHYSGYSATYKAYRNTQDKIFLLSYT